MKAKYIIYLLIGFTVFSIGCKEDDTEEEVDTRYVIDDADSIRRVYTLHTSKGKIDLFMYRDAPIHRYNFDSLSQAGFYDGTIFHRVIPNFVIQGGDPTGSGSGGPGYTLKAEINAKYKHKHGAVGAARTNNPEKRSSGSQFYIVDDANGEKGLDGGYTVFGETLTGLDVVKAIASVKRGAKDKPEVDVVLDSISMNKYSLKELESKYKFTAPD